MAMATAEKSHVDVIVGDGGRCHLIAGNDAARDGSLPDAADGARGSSDERRCPSASRTEIVGVSERGRGSSVSESSVEVDLERGVPEIKLHLATIERDCRICQLSLDSVNQESGVPIELGCSCKDDLAAAHRQCAEAWFKIKGNKTCEICGSLARNVVGSNETELIEQWDEANDAAAAATTVTAPMHPADTQNCWQGHRFLNFLLACMVFAFVISWLFHFNVPS
ncbi:uncharacterized protein LOC131167033 [Malania oleifera]|uniref:uncharacterized protein LOC131167033 n=1 Tax=Malania oleifera TaxID=397392 RepID=UPI0025AE9F74|nr:uncharacterized protein LOC131167033 [Malania oleifera]